MVTALLTHPYQPDTPMALSLKLVEQNKMFPGVEIEKECGLPYLQQRAFTWWVLGGERVW